MHDAPWEHYHDIGDPSPGHDDVVVWTSVGIDIGSSTSQLVFSRITMARRDSHYVVAERTVLHESDILLTPYVSPAEIDAKRIRAFVDREYVAAGFRREQVDNGAVILTGLALAAANARNIADALADHTGRFVAVSAGDVLEARLAAQGAGAPFLSSGIDGVLVHIDIGGGTTKLTAWHAGQLLGVAALDIGARIVTTDGHGRVRRIEEPARRIKGDLHLDLEEGAPLQEAVAARIAGAMARNLLRYAGVLREAPRGQPLLRTAPLFAAPPMIDAVVFSGGVSEYVYGREGRQFGDLGLLLGAAIRREIGALGTRVLPSDRGIRATVLGVSQHSLQLSGNTVFVSDEWILPLRNLPIVIPALDLAVSSLDRERLRTGIESALALHGNNGVCPAIALRWNGSATHERICALAGAIADALATRRGETCVVAIDGDVAGLLGETLHENMARSVVCLDSIHVHEFDHIDIGSFAPNTRALPVIVKSLLFAGSPHRDAHHA
jgi:ethanolamine utilization protein EutA